MITLLDTVVADDRFIDRGDRYSGARFDKDDRYRYVLWRRWDDEPGGILLVCMLNPSKADQNVLDPTVGGIMARLRLWASEAWSRNEELGYRELRVINLYAWRSTDPKALFPSTRKRRGSSSEIVVVDDGRYDPVGFHNDAVIAAELTAADTVVCGWGRNARADRVEAFRRISAQTNSDLKLRCFRKLSDGTPEHPLYVPHALPLVAWP